ncbi:MAG TPA: FAD-binding oxidoreductase [Candidatus Dormibacteraeota bacterium]|nr:FAD-binding oxidoreductase [Candidatus Dormibacteraeota bacterium]
MSLKAHPWGVPPWGVDFRPKACPLPEHVDFAIVGGGFTGLSAAAWLGKLMPRNSVLVLEASSLGEGASGRTGGLALADTALGPLPELGDVLARYKEILRTLHVDARLELPGVYELGRANAREDSPICWNDSGSLQVVRTVPGGAIDPAKVVSGLARAAERAGAQIVEHAEVQAIQHSSPLGLDVRRKVRSRTVRKEIRARQVLLATNAFSLELAALCGATQPKLTLALATAPLGAAELKAIGLSSRRPFYTVDLPYLWGRLLNSNAIVFGAGLLPMPTSLASLSTKPAKHSHQSSRPNLYRFDVRKGEAVESFRRLESRVHHLHPALKSVRITHRWAGPILFTEGMRPIFRRHPRSENVMVLAGYNGHGVALSVYLGRWAAEALLGRRSLPSWQ